MKKIIYRLTWTLDNTGLEDLGHEKFETITSDYENEAAAIRQINVLEKAKGDGRVTEYNMTTKIVDEEPYTGMTNLFKDLF